MSTNAAEVMALFEGANDLYRQGRLREAAEQYQRVLNTVPNYVPALSNLGAVMDDLGDTDHAIACYLSAISYDPSFADAHFNLGNALKKLGQFAATIECYCRATNLQPNRPEFRLGLANTLFKVGRLGDAELLFHQITQTQPESPDVLTGWGLVKAEQGEFRQAIDLYSRAIQLSPQHPHAHRNRALMYLLLGEFPAGWTDYEWRWRCPDFPGDTFTQPRWDGLPSNKTVLVHSEQGIGDTIQFSRFLPMVRERVGRVILATRPELIPLLTASRVCETILSLNAEIPPVDAQIPLMSLPFALNLAGNLGMTSPYLIATDERLSRWRKFLESFSGLRVGICWRGSSGNGYYRDHKIPNEALATLSALTGVTWFSLLREEGRAGEGGLPFSYVNLSPELDRDGNAFMDTAAIMKCLDLVISFDTSVAHVAGALGCPVWIVLPFVPDWRWELERTDSRWYPTARLFRQPSAGDWHTPLREIAAELHQLRDASPMSE